MNRFMGMMPSSEIKATRYFDAHGNTSVDAGPNGWTITWPDSSTNYQDIFGTTDENMNRAILVLKKHFPNAVEITVNRGCDVCVDMGESFDEDEDED